MFLERAMYYRDQDENLGLAGLFCDLKVNKFQETMLAIMVSFV